MNPLILPILEIGRAIFERFVPDPQKKAEAELELLRMAADGELKQVIAQLEINAREASHPSLWVAGWRPFFGWVGGASFAYVGIARPLLGWIAGINGWPEPPGIDTELLWVVVSGLLGIGGLRTFEKAKNIAER